MKEIGGYFELELNSVNNFPHYDGVLLNSARNAFEYILRNLMDAKKLYIPYYTCEVVLEPLNKVGIEYEFYGVNADLELADNINLTDGEYILYTNYFGIKDSYIKKLAEVYEGRLIVDNAQALYAEHLSGVNTFYSPRKFVGIPDGGVAYIDSIKDTIGLPIDESYDRFSHLLKRIDKGASFAYTDFRENSHKLVGEPIKQMSNLTSKLIEGIDFNSVKNRRIENFKYLHNILHISNKLTIPSLESFACPMVYPYMTDDDSLRVRLIENKVFVATYWPNVFQWVKETDVEYYLTKNIIPIPVDQRYGKEDMERIIKIITT